MEKKFGMNNSKLALKNSLHSPYPLKEGVGNDGTIRVPLKPITCLSVGDI